jgi:hypothetical protein
MAEPTADSASGDTVQAAVYLATDADRAKAKEVLGDLEPGGADHFSGVIEGELDRAKVAELNKAGLVVSLFDGPIPPTGHHHKWVEDNCEEIEELHDENRGVSLNEDGDALVLGDADSPPDHRLHRIGGPEPTPAQALPEDAYNVELDTPITQEQRDELHKLGVHIAALEPGYGYRTFLTKDQYKKVRRLPWVAAVRRYRFSQTVTPELLDLAEAEREPAGASLSGDAAGPAKAQIFDCLLHREEDLAKVADLIENSPDTKVIEQTNLRVRFEARPDLPLLTGLASLPEVRKVSPYEAPAI